jgi:hypothetical protein
MKAMVQDRYGSADVLEFRDVEDAAVGDDEVLVRVHAAGGRPGGGAPGSGGAGGPAASACSASRRSASVGGSAETPSRRSLVRTHQFSS